MDSKGEILVAFPVQAAIAGTTCPLFNYRASYCWDRDPNHPLCLKRCCCAKHRILILSSSNSRGWISYYRYFWSLPCVHTSYTAWRSRLMSKTAYWSTPALWQLPPLSDPIRIVCILFIQEVPIGTVVACSMSSGVVALMQWRPYLDHTDRVISNPYTEVSSTSSLAHCTLIKHLKYT